MQEFTQAGAFSSKQGIKAVVSDEKHAALEQRVGEVERLLAHMREQLTLHAGNVEKARDHATALHKETNASLADAIKRFEGKP